MERFLAVRLPLILGVILLLCGVALFIVRGAPTPGSGLALSTDGGWAESKPFRISPSGRYRASLQIDKTFPFRESECLADVGHPFLTSGESGRRIDCPPGFSPGTLEWTLSASGRPVELRRAFGEHAGEYQTAVLGRSLGIVDLAGGRRYVLRGRIVDASPSLASAHPRLRVDYDDGASLIVSTFLVAATCIGLISVGVIVLALAIRRILRPPSPASPAPHPQDANPA